MKAKNIIIFALLIGICTVSCDPLDTKVDVLITQDNLESDYTKLFDLGYAPYTYIRNGFYSIDNNISAAMTDEAEYTMSSSSVQAFNEGSWNQYHNPDDMYNHLYAGLRAANFFLDYSMEYKKLLAHNRDTLSDNGYSYNRDVLDIAWLRAEARVLRAFFYFELTKRYGDVALVKEVLPVNANQSIPRQAFDEIVEYAVGEIDAVTADLQLDWKSYDSNKDGRFTRGAALALKSRILLYAASPRHNPLNDLSKWQRAAQAAFDVIDLGQYTLADNYRTLFLEDNSITSQEIIMSQRLGSNNAMERANYPVGTPGGNSGVTPSHNLVSAYEYKGTPDPDNPYANRDPRLGYSIVTNNSSWNGRTIEIHSEGDDAWTNPNASRTGYYLKKFLVENLYLVQNEIRMHNWVMFRYAEILLNYAEAMNEAYGPDNDNGFGLSARDAVNMIRNRAGVEMPAVTASNALEMKNCIKHERRIELVFEEHRYWDLLRWKDAETVLGEAIKGVRATKIGENQFSYTEFIVESRVFDASKMYFYPIPQTEINKSNGVLEQNKGW